MRIPKTLSKGERIFWEIKKELERTNLTLEDEYEKILNKKSILTKSQRDYLVLMVKTKEELTRIKNKNY